MIYEYKFSYAVRSIELNCGTDSKISIEIGKTDEEKINKWLNKIVEENKSLDLMYFPVLTYIIDSTGNIGNTMVIKEHISREKLDLTNIDLW